MRLLITYMTSLLVLFAFVPASAQNLNRVENKVKAYPTTYSTTTELVRQIENDFKTDREKAEAAFVWIARNIAYDCKAVTKTQKISFSYRSQSELEAKKEEFRKTLTHKSLISRKALCEGYSTLYQDLCRQMNIECVIVPGIARRNISDIGKQNLPSNHAWNAVNLNGKWILVDATWAAGWVDYSKMKFHKHYSSAYFSSPPKEFAMKHFPDDKKWLLSQKIKSINDFALQPIPFKAFLGKNIKILSPKKGMLQLERGKPVAFKFVNIPNGIDIAYHFKKDKYGQKLKSYRNKDSLQFKIYPEYSGKDELIIYFNNEPALGYQVNVK